MIKGRWIDWFGFRFWHRLKTGKCSFFSLFAFGLPRIRTFKMCLFIHFSVRVNYHAIDVYFGFFSAKFIRVGCCLCIELLKLPIITEQQSIHSMWKRTKQYLVSVSGLVYSKKKFNVWSTRFFLGNKQ